MSWLSDKTGRPKEQGGHQRINISVDEPTFDVLQSCDNRSKYIEYCINAGTYSKRIRFHEPKVTANNNNIKFKTATRFVWTPNNSTNNAILSIRCYFQYCCAGKGFRVRMVINDEACSSDIGGLTSINYTWSPIYTDYDFGIKTFPNQSNYTIEFQFAPENSSDTAYVKNINLLMEVIDGMPALPR